jgi:transposase
MVAMSFREVQVHEIREVLRLWLRGESERAIARLSLVDRKTVKRYVTAGAEAGLVRDGGEGQLSDGLIGVVCERLRPHRPDGHGAGWETLRAHHDQLKTWLVDEGLTVVKTHELLARQGLLVPQRTLHRYALEVLGVGRSARRSTVPVADGDPGVELQVDFGKMGLIFDTVSGRRRVCWALIFTAVYSRHCFVWLSFAQTTETVIAGFEAAWAFFGGVFKVVIPDNMSSVITTADKLEPRFNPAFIEYAQSRAFVVDPARVRTPTDKVLASYCTSWLGFDTARFPLLSVFGAGRPADGLAWCGLGQPVVVLASAVEGFGAEQPLLSPAFDRLGVCA